MTGREKLLAWIEQQHEGQLIRKTKLPYSHHLKAVAEMADVAPSGYETGLCHDLLEDTTVTIDALHLALLNFGYSEVEALVIVNGVVDLTNVYTKKAYQGWKKPIRKKKEAERLATISPLAQTVKYADLIYNLDWMLTFDTKHIKKYLRKKKALLEIMTNGDQYLHRKLMRSIDSVT
ncbi:hypothetical protein [Mucilaginibacter jinjuensis]|uniref:HD domain-containing protein n=1 Tax=Mucilaginibacter jinjuensis TaxID=1176721 RepID=A0ABY7TAP9_9SPHI|nr:hypothetical protein [Mucilaginibacter jinjuensis]WCT13309.1 hypothetical protein PQO05_05105 [Mucilaginibacter jinjuensis]